jgi:hypothetical protein
MSMSPPHLKQTGSHCSSAILTHALYLVVCRGLFGAIAVSSHDAVEGFHWVVEGSGVLSLEPSLEGAGPAVGAWCCAVGLV